jgi:hypothetical protein
MTNTILVLLLSAISIPGLAQESIIRLLPDPFDLPELQTAGKYELFESDDLHKLNSENAGVYQEYGFVQAITQDYTGINGDANLRIEIYQMTDPEAAFGIFAFSAIGQKIIDKIVYYLVLGDDYRMMVKGSYFIIVSYANLPEALEKNILEKISKGIDANVKEFAELPRLLVSSQPPCHDTRQSLYFRGKLAMQKIVYLDFKLPFAFSEGVYYRCDVFGFLLLIPGGNQSKKELLQETVGNILKKNPDFKVSSELSGFSIKENDHLKYEVTTRNNSLVLIKYY